MPIQVTCACGKTLNAPDEAAGQRVRCPACGNICEVPSEGLRGALALSGEKGIGVAGEPPTRPFLTEVALAFAYPLTGTGLAILAGVVVCYLLGWLIPIGGIAVLILLDVFLVAYFFTIVQASAGGERRQPGLPDATDLWEDLIRPIFWMLAAAIVSAIPLFVYVFWIARGERHPPDPVVMGLLSAWWSLYFPMAILALALTSSFAALSPHIVLPAIVRIPGPYLVLAVFVWLAWNGYLFAVGQVGDSVVGAVASFVALVYVSWVIARAIGITHWVYRERLGWFARS